MQGAVCFAKFIYYPDLQTRFGRTFCSL